MIEEKKNWIKHCYRVVGTLQGFTHNSDIKLTWFEFEKREKGKKVFCVYLLSILRETLKCKI